VVPGAEEAYDPKVHDLESADTGASAEGVVDRVVAPGLSFQGQLLRKAVVALHERPSPSQDTDVMVRPTVPEPSQTVLLRMPAAAPEPRVDVGSEPVAPKPEEETDPSPPDAV